MLELHCLNQDDEVIESIKYFRKLENLINNLENILNKFLIHINLLCTFNIIVNDVRKKLISEFLEDLKDLESYAYAGVSVWHFIINKKEKWEKLK